MNREHLMRYNTVESITLDYLPSVPKLNTRTRVRSRITIHLHLVYSMLINYSVRESIMRNFGTRPNNFH